LAEALQCAITRLEERKTRVKKVSGLISTGNVKNTYG